MTESERAERTARLKAARVATGREPTIQSTTTYAVLAAVLTATELSAKAT